MSLSQIVPTDFFEIPDGPAGTRQTLKYMREEVRKDVGNTWLREITQQIVRDVAPKDWWGEMCAIFYFVKEHVRYGLDPNGIELVQAPHVTMMLGYGDCDDLTCLISCMCEQLGHATMLCALGFDADENYSHVLPLCIAAGSESDPIALDATEEWPPGWFPPNDTYRMIAPIR